MAEIYLRDILNLGDLNAFKAHCAVRNDYGDQPLDVFARDRSEWHGWNAYKGQRDDFNRKYIFSLMSFYHEVDTWLFGGVYEVKGITDGTYDVALIDVAEEYIGRLKLKFRLPYRNRRPKLENCFDDFVVSEILPEQYTGQEFVGFDSIDISYGQLEAIVKNQKSDWRGALQNVKGVYLITDVSAGKRYVGSAYGDAGVWARWSCYVETGHGYNDELTKLIAEKGMGYARQHFRFSLLEFRPMSFDDRLLIEREGYWKQVLLTRGQWGYNKN
ncbi:MAG: GIY-YIG nuclease family protein [Alphaproteobacteria bacterium]|nr:MAG: GIY-YIG nuclease family protein [Alphaproteobacteria bacterium]